MSFIIGLHFSTSSSAPTVVSYSPANGQSNVNANDIITLTFSEFVQRGGGTVSLTPSAWTFPGGTIGEDSPDPINIPISDAAQVILSGSQVKIDPFASFLTGGEVYKVTFAAGGVMDAQGVDFSGIYGDTYTFTTIDNILPTIVSYEPQLGSTSVGFAPDGDPIVLTFNEAVQFGSPVGATLTFGVNSMPLNNRLISGVNVTFDPSASLSPGVQYTVNIPAGHIKDLSGNSFAGISGTTYQFRVASPNTQTLACNLGSECTLTMSGAGLQMHNRIRWIKTGSCGSSACDDVTPSPRPFYPDSNPQNYKFGVLSNTAPGSYTMCWASLGRSRYIGEGTKISDCLEYYFAVGTITLAGPSSITAWDPTSGLPVAGRGFVLTVLGTGLASTNRVRIVDYNVQCGLAASSVSTNVLVAGSTAAAGTLSGSTSMAWTGLQLSLAGNYRVCWCSGFIMSSLCNTDAEFNVDASTFTIAGPYAMQDGGSTVSSLACGFETLTSAGCRVWGQFNTSDNLQWVHHTGATPSSNTGPTAAKTGTHYMYLEASAYGVITGHEAFLSMRHSLGAGAQLSFWYHMQGTGVGSLKVQFQFAFATAWKTLWILSGHQGTAWSFATIDLSSYAGPDRSLRFVATRGSSATGDIAIDDVTVTVGTIISGGWIGSNMSAVVYCASTTCASSWSLYGSSFVVSRSLFVGAESESIHIDMQEVWDHTSQTAVQVPAIVRWQQAKLSTGDYFDFVDTIRVGRSRLAVSTGPGKTLTYLPSQIILPSGPKRLLWSSDEFGTNEGWQFQVVPFGNLNPAVRAPFALQLVGSGLTTNDRISIIESRLACGATGAATSTSRLVGSLGAGSAGSSGSTSTTLLWPGLMITDSLSVLAVGTYRVCWCADQAAGCNTDAEFGVEAGTFAVNGPTAVQEGELGGYLLAWTGKAFSLQIAGQGLSFGDRVKVLPDSVPCGGTASYAVSGNVSGQGLAGTTGVSSTSLRWSGVEISAQGTYKVCWCWTKDWLPSDCDQDSDFSVDVGTFQVKGGVNAETAAGGVGPGRGVAPAPGQPIGIVDQLLDPSGVVVKNTQATSMGPHGYEDAGTSVVFVSDTHNHRVVQYSSQTSTQALQCASAGCTGSVSFEVGGRRDCSVSAALYITDFHEPDERVEWIKVEGIVVATDCSPGRDCQTSDTYSCLVDYDISSYILYNDMVTISAKISNSVDSCPKGGNLLHLDISLTCVTGISAPTTWIGGQQQGYNSNQLDTPEGIYLDSDGSIWVQDSSNHRVSAWSSTTAGTQTKTFATMTSFNSAASKLSGRYALNADTASSAGSVYKVSADNDGVLRWHYHSSSWQCVAGCHGVGSHSYQIHGVGGTFADDTNALLYVADVNNHRVSRFGVNVWYANCQFACGSVAVAGGNGAGSNANQLHYPGSIFLVNTDVYVVDCYNHRIQKWSSPYTTGQTVAGSAAGLSGDADDRLNYPSSIYVSSALDVFVFDHGNNRLMKWTAGASSGVMVSGGSGSTTYPFNVDPEIPFSGGTEYNFTSVLDELHYPSSVFKHTSGIFTTDTLLESRIQQRNADGVIIGHIPTTASVGSGQGQLHYPGSLFVDSSGNVYVADWSNHRVQKYNPTGGGSWSIVAGTGVPGDGYDQLRFPYGIFLDKSNNLYVADTHNHRIMLWKAGSSVGELVVGQSPTLQGDTDTKLYFPIGLHIDYFGKLFVVDSRNQRVQSWNLGHERKVYQCAVGVICILRLPAAGLYTGSTNRIRIYRANKQCGDTNVDINEADGYSDVLSTTLTNLVYNPLVDSSKIGLYVLGIPTGYDTDTSFTVCWGSNPTQDTDYAYSVGTFFLIGPKQNQDHSCYAGVQCTIGPFSGRGLTQDNWMAFVAEAGDCGFDNRDPFVASNSYAQLTGILTLSLSSSDLPIGGMWKMCFCTALYGGCDDAGDFISEAGILTVKGPNDLHQDQYCTAGVPCTFGPFTGQGLTSLDRLELVPATGSCGEAARDPDIASDAAVIVDAYLQSYLMASEVPYGGQWNICYCTEGQCDTGSNFTVQAGVLTVRGPSPLTQNKNCTAGSNCLITQFTGQWLSTRDQIAMVHIDGTCGVNDRDPSIMRNTYKSVEVLTSALCTDPWEQNCQTEVNFVGVGPSIHALDNDLPLSGRTSTASNSALDGDLPYGGVWRLCYCANYLDCAAASSFTVQAGNLTVRGPTPISQDRTCVAGQTCLLDGIEGQDLVSGDRLMILDTCGVNSVNLGFGHVGGVQNWPNNGISAAATFGGTIFSYNLSVIAIGSTYRLCWCPVGEQCSAAEHFVVDFGQFTFVGPNPINLGPQTFSQDRTCVSGQTCVLTGITGQHLTDSDSFMMMDTCATLLSRIPRLPNSGSVVTVGASGATLQWPGIFPTAMGGEYRLCWCAGAYTCGNDLDFRVDVGHFLLLGPRPLTHSRTCVSGQLCSWQISGENLRDGDQMIALDTCGSITPLPRWPNTGPSNDASNLGHLFSWGSVALTGSGGEYRLCWCSNGRDVVQYVGIRQQYSCSTAEQFRVDIGRLTVVGPAPLTEAETGRWLASAPRSSNFVQSRTCVAGMTCSLVGLTGHYLSNTDSFFVLETCGFHNTIPRFANGGIGMLVERSGAAVSFGSTPVTTPGGVYQLCWCASGYSCGFGNDYKVTMALLHIVGPTPLYQDRTCVSGQTCVLDGITGKDLDGGSAAALSNATTTNQSSFFVLDTCGQVHLPSSAFVLQRFPGAGVYDSVGTGGSVVTWGPNAVTAPGGQYRLCWCSHMGSSCSTADDFKVDVGSFLLVGTKVAGNDKTCVAGQSCVLTGIMGQDLSTKDKYFVMDTCGESSVIPKFPEAGMFVFVESNNATVSWSSVPLTVAGGLYRLCWCAGLYPYRCSASDKFRVDVGSFALMGPAPLSQHQTCVAGQTCYIKDLQGFALSSNDTLMVLDTCQPQYAVAYPDSNYTTTTYPNSTFQTLTGWSTTTFAVPKFPQAGLALTIGASGATASWGATFVTAAGGVYRLCWCSGKFSCSSSSDAMRVDMGALTLIGMSPLSQDRTCVSGQECAFDGFLGVSVHTANDVLFVLDTCGTKGALPRSFNFGLAPSVLASGASFGWGSSIMTVAGGQYRLCWCAASVYTCSVTEDARLVMVIYCAWLDKIHAFKFVFY
jgi:sugar lactone lactonase YvrE